MAVWQCADVTAAACGRGRALRDLLSPRACTASAAAAFLHVDSPSLGDLVNRRVFQMFWDFHLGPSSTFLLISMMDYPFGLLA